VSVARAGRSWGLLVVSLVIAGVAFWLTKTYLSSQENKLRQQLLDQQGAYANVVVASKDIIPGDVISLENMAVAQVPISNLSSSAVMPEQFGGFEGQVVRNYMSTGEPLLNHFVAGIGIERFSDLLDDGERAVTLEIDDINSVSGMLLPGDFVDIMMLLEEESDTQELAGNDNKNLKPLLQKVRILAVDALSLVSKEQDFIAQHSGYDDSMQYSSVTVGVGFDDAAKLILARDIGDLVFMLRNKEDRAHLKSDLLTKEDLLHQNNSNSKSYKYYSSAKPAGSSRIVSSAKFLDSQRTIKSQPVLKEFKANKDEQVSTR